MNGILRGAVAALALMALAAAPAWAGNPNVLWQIAHDRCVPDEASLHTPLPCTTVDTARGFVILKDIRGATQFLLIPTARISGIEDPALLAPFARSYWQDAWNARNDVIAMDGHALQPADLSLAVNSAYGRTQNQLHIHIDCIAPAVRDALVQHAAGIGEAWTDFPDKLAGHAYRVRRVRALDQPGADPFRLVAKELPGARDDMGRESLLVTGAEPPDHAQGFYILETRADAATGNRGSAEELQDHDCAVARP